MHDVIRRLKEAIPELAQIYFRQDNAGCYHSANTLLAVADLAKCTGVHIRAMDFSDPQGGKGSCDRKAALLKRYMSTYANEGHDIEDGRQMKKALESVHVSGNVCVALSSSASSVLPRTTETKWEGVSFLNNFEFTEAGVRVWRAFNVGPGRFLKWDTFAHLPECKPLENVEEPKKSGQFTVMVSTAKSAQAPRPSQPRDESVQMETEKENIFFCPEDGCIKSYQRLSGLERHILAGKHNFEKNN